MLPSIQGKGDITNIRHITQIILFYNSAGIAGITNIHHVTQTTLSYKTV